MWNLLSILAFSGAVVVGIRCPFESPKGADPEEGIYLNVSIGTPGQQLQMRLTQDTKETFLGVQNTKSFDGAGGFDPTASSTFKKTGVIDETYDKGVAGTDNFLFDGTTFKNMPFNVYDNDKYYGKHGAVSLAQPTGGQFSFIQELLKTQNQSTAVVFYDQVDFNIRDQIKGVLVLGEQPKECSTNWTRVKQATGISSVNWAFKIDMITIGKFQKRNPGNAGINFAVDFLIVPPSIFSTIEQAVGSDNNGNVPCDSTTKIVLNVNGIDLEVGPATYVSQPDDGKCIFEAGEYAEGYYELPAGVLANLCIMFDYGTNEVGFAQRLR